MHAMNNSRKLIIENSVQYILGCILILSAITKFYSINSFMQDVQLYIDLYLFDFLHDWSHVIAVLLCVYELVLGMLVLIGWYKLLVRVMLVAVFSLFLYLTGLNAFFPSEFYGSIESCGCFGELIHFTPVESFYKSVVLWSLSVMLLVIMSRIKDLFFFCKK